MLKKHPQNVTRNDQWS